jgi:hypothetical protein
VDIIALAVPAEDRLLSDRAHEGSAWALAFGRVDGLRDAGADRASQGQRNTRTAWCPRGDWVGVDDRVRGVLAA